MRGKESMPPQNLCPHKRAQVFPSTRHVFVSNLFAKMLWSTDLEKIIRKVYADFEEIFSVDNIIGLG